MGFTPVFGFVTFQKAQKSLLEKWSESTTKPGRSAAGSLNWISWAVFHYNYTSKKLRFDEMIILGESSWDKLHVVCMSYMECWLLNKAYFSCLHWNMVTLCMIVIKAV